MTVTTAPARVNMPIGDRGSAQAIAKLQRQINSILGQLGVIGPGSISGSSIGPIDGTTGIIANTITAQSIATDLITSSIIQGDSISLTSSESNTNKVLLDTNGINAYDATGVNTLTISASDGSITVYKGTITGAVIQTGGSAVGTMGDNKVMMDSTGIKAFDSIGNTTVEIDTNGVLTVSRGSLTFSSTVPAGTGARVKIDQSGIAAYNSSNVQEFFLDASSGALTANSATITGTINASAGTISGTLTVSGALQTAASGARAVMNSSGFLAYNTLGTQTITLSATDGSASFTGAVSITGSTTLGGTLTVSGTATLTGSIQTAASGARVTLDSTGLKAYSASSGSTPTVNIDAATGLITATGIFFVNPGSTVPTATITGSLPGSANRYSNSSFQDGQNHFDLTGWTVTNASGASGGATAPPVYGVLTLQLTATGGDEYVLPSTVVDSYKRVLPGLFYAFSHYVYPTSTARQSRVDILWYDSTGTLLSTISGTAQNTVLNQWTRIVQIAQAPSNAAYAVGYHYTAIGAVSGELTYTECFQMEQGDRESAWAPRPDEILYQQINANNIKVNYLSDLTAAIGTLTSGEIDSAVVQTSSAANSTGGVRLDSTGLYGYASPSGGQIFSLTSSGLTISALGSTGINVGGGQFTVSSAGVVVAQSATITGTITTSNLTVTGLGAGGINVNSGVFQVSSAGAVTASSISITGGSITIGSNFSVTSSGVLNAQSATLSGTITATGGTFTGSVQITSGALVAGTPGGARVQVDNTGINAYNSSNANTYTVSSVDGSVTLRSSGTLTVAGTILSGTPGGARVQVDNTGINAYNSSNANTYTVSSSDGSVTLRLGGILTVAGTILAGTPTGARIQIDGSGINAYNSSNTITYTVSSTTGSLTIQSGGTLTVNGTIQSSSSGVIQSSSTATTNGVQMTSSGLFGYSGGNPVFSLSSSGLSLTGSITATSGTIQGNLVVSGALQTASSGARTQLDSNGLRVWNSTPTEIIRVGHGSGVVLTSSSITTPLQSITFAKDSVTGNAHATILSTFTGTGGDSSLLLSVGTGYLVTVLTGQGRAIVLSAGNSGGTIRTATLFTDSGTSDFLQSANNLNEFSGAATSARNNLGLGTSNSPTFTNLTLSGTATINGGTGTSLDVNTGAGNDATIIIAETAVSGYSHTPLKGTVTNTAGTGYNLLVLQSALTLTNKMFVDGTGAIHSTSMSITSISDRNLKRDIEPLQSSLGLILALKPRQFRWGSHRLMGHVEGQRGYGLVADEVETVFPHLVIDDYPVDGDSRTHATESVKAIRWGGQFTTYLIGAVQELEERQRGIIQAAKNSDNYDDFRKALIDQSIDHTKQDLRTTEKAHFEAGLLGKENLSDLESRMEHLSNQLSLLAA